MIWCDPRKVQMPAHNLPVGPGLVATVQCDVELPLWGHTLTRHEYRVSVQQATTHPDETVVVVGLGPAWSETLRAEGSLELPTPLGFTLYLCEAP